MTEDLEINASLNAVEYKKAYDACCKKLLSNKQILAHIIKECVDEFKEVDLEEIPACIDDIQISSDKIQGLNVEDESILGARIQYDILFKLTTPIEQEQIDLIINIEAQNKDNPRYDLVSRAIYYCCRLISRQKNDRNYGFENSHYENIKKVYSIWICLEHSKEKDDCIHRYSIQHTNVRGDAEVSKKSYDLFTIVMLYPSKSYDYEDNRKSLLEMLNVLFSSELSARYKKNKLTADYGILMVKEINEEVESMCNLSDGVYEKGIQQGREQGLLQGRQQGIQQCRTDYIQKLSSKLNISIKEAMDLLDIDEEDRITYRVGIQKR